MKNSISALITSLVCVLIAYLVAFACSFNSLNHAGIPVIFYCLVLAFLIQWVVFLPSFYFQTEHLYDLTGTFTYISIIITSVFYNLKINEVMLSNRKIIISSLVCIWALRLGIFLFIRVIKVGEDKRFHVWKKSFMLFFRTWTIQGLWVFLTAITAITAITSNNDNGIEFTFYIGFSLWVFGFLFESISDYQKMIFKFNPVNKNKFIHTGLWSMSRHPNYFGEIIIWFGMAIMCVPVLAGLQYISLISPVFVYLLLTKVSGTPILEKQADTKWGTNEEYKKYKKNTPEIFPRF